MLLFALMMANAPDVDDGGAVRLQNLRAATGTGGACSGTNVSTPATVVLTWDSFNIVAPDYQIRVYLDNEHVDTLVSTLKTWTKTVTGYVELGLKNRFAADWRFRVDLLRANDLSVVTSLDVSWRQLYGKCPLAE